MYIVVDTDIIPYILSYIIQILKMIRLYPSAGVKHVESGELVSWCLTYDFGAIGMLHTCEVRI